jgi:hypothetical protein
MEREPPALCFRLHVTPLGDNQNVLDPSGLKAFHQEKDLEGPSV